jgi:carboxyl-terminal processing protease
MTTAINSMLKDLDPYTTYLPEDAARDLEVQTAGQYAGVGVGIAKINNRFTVTEVFKGSPADKSGLKAGDIIVRVDDNKIDNMESEVFNSQLRGKPNSNVWVEYLRDSSLHSVTITREKIRIKAVEYFGMIDSENAYIQLSAFSRNSSDEVKQALRELKDKGAKRLILDLRSNPGGLLSEAVKVSNLFIDKNNVIVETKGRIEEWNNKYLTDKRVYDKNIPLAVLINRKSASAAEIVAGAIQDLDRGIIVGEKSFGKGLVQQPRDLEYNTKLKVTIAKYYTPSGRCIQSRDYFNNENSNEEVNDSLRKVFYTKNGRMVFDSDGITPDVNLNSEYFSEVTSSLYSKRMIFLYSVYWNYTHDVNESISIDFEDFKQFLVSKEFSFKSRFQIELEKSLDSTKISDKSDQFKIAALNTLNLAKQESHYALDQNKDEITKEIKRNIVLVRSYRFNMLESEIKDDKLVQLAITNLENTETYNNLLAKK